MVAVTANSPRSNSQWHAQFLRLLPGIREYAQRRFWYMGAEQREECVQEVVAYALLAFVRLVELCKLALAYPSPLARYGVARVRDGRHVGSSFNKNDITSEYCQRTAGLKIDRLDRIASSGHGWKEVLVEDRHAGPAEIATSRIDFHDWLLRLPKKKRQIAEALAQGETTSVVARRFQVSSARISQYRNELAADWNTFQAEASAEVVSARV